MHKKLFCGLFMLTIILLGPVSYAEEGDAWDGMAKKLQRGLINTFTGPADFPFQIVKGYDKGFMGQEGNKLFGMFAGAIKGVLYGAGRTISGVVDIVTFWAVSPQDNENVGLPLDSEYVWEEGDNYNMMEPDIIEAAIRPMVNKLFRGAGNTVFGFVEFPDQISKGVSEGAPDWGIGKALWYWSSREIMGISDLAGALIANPKEPAGAVLDEKKPWEIYSKRKADK